MAENKDCEYLEKTKDYWSTRHEGYSNYINEELNSKKRKIWLDMINRYRPEGKSLRILDAGCGPGFFPVLLAKEGHHVTAVDYTPQMLETTEQNVNNYGVADNVTIKRENLLSLSFDDNTFDMVISRNVTWMVTDPVKVYREWLRDLKKGGCFLNFDSNFLFSLYDEELKRQHEINEKEAVKMGYVPTPNDHLADGMDKILPEFPSASHHRPQWDMENLINMDFKKITLDKTAYKGLLKGFDEILGKTHRMFMIKGEK